MNKEPFMNIQLILGVFVVTVAAVCGTLLLIKRIDVAFQERKFQRELEEAGKNRRQQMWVSSYELRWEALYQEEKQRRITQEAINNDLRKTIRRQNELLGRVKVVDL